MGRPGGTAITAHRTNRRTGERSLALSKAKSEDAIEGYSGIRISRKGRRFMIQNARIWTLWDQHQHACGQAASFSNWWWI
jgi:hypothetical protein